MAAILFALKLPLRGDDGFDELRFRAVFFELEVEAFDARTALPELLTEVEVIADRSREPLWVIEQNDELLIRLRVHKGQKSLHPWPLEVV
ncbi:MAG: hypothetical protein AAGG09_00625 [Pseudomonadota bacterium]